MTVRCWHDRWDRRTFLGLLAVGLTAAMSECTVPVPRANHSTPLPRPPVGEPELPPPATQLGAAVLELRSGPTDTRQIALTIDDGYCNECVAGYVAFAQRTGTHLTFSPNGCYAHAWAPHAAELRPLIEARQVQIMNHTYNHHNLTQLPAVRVQQELEENEQWITQTFGTTARPYYRPPFGAHDSRVDNLAAKVGFNRVVMWNGSFGDSIAITPQFLLAQARRYLRPGVMMLGHANHPTILGLFDQITELIRDRQLQPVTLSEMFGPHR